MESGGGGDGAKGANTAQDGTVNTGGGGGATGYNGSSFGTNGGGGSGVVIIKMPDGVSCNVGAGLTSSTSGQVVTFNGTGTVTFS